MVRAKVFQQYLAQCVAECFSTFMLILIGEAAIAQYKFTARVEQSPLVINLSFGIGVYTGLMIAGPISGAHLNPAVTISLLTLRKIKPLQCLFYIIGQMLGAFLGAMCVYFLYYSLFNQYDHGVRAVTGATGTADIFFTMPTKGVVHWNSFFDQIIGTAILMIFIMALGYKYNGLISDAAKPFAFVALITAITSAFAGNCGAAINPARDLAPRIFAAFIYGWNDVFQAHDYFFWIPIFGPILGGIIGVWIFEGYSKLMDRFAYMPHTTIESHPQVLSIDDDDQAMIAQKLTSIQS